ncbi:hypothetical protein HK103_002110 [Boothiomyces macroporosus]|uniref:Uncharacterized protein n=1 Tax=Boothiomyces macroporosus TaxID=261099 RepID=A0AAD5Y6W3_9FUNG|nr:hypothetical protein HK103_002110 [Boothiomyces macroporosus]
MPRYNDYTIGNLSPGNSTGDQFPGTPGSSGGTSPLFLKLAHSRREKLTEPERADSVYSDAVPSASLIQSGFSSQQSNNLEKRDQLPKSIFEVSPNDVEANKEIHTDENYSSVQDELNSYPITEASADDEVPKTPQRPYTQENKNIHYVPPKMANEDLVTTPKASDYNTYSYSEGTHPTYKPETMHSYSQKTYPTYDPNNHQDYYYPTFNSNHPNVYRDLNPDSTYNSELHGPQHTNEVYANPRYSEYYDYVDQHNYPEAYDLQPNYSQNLDATGNQNHSKNLDYAGVKIQTHEGYNYDQQNYHYDPNYTALYEKIKDQEPPEDDLYPTSEAFLENFHSNMITGKNETLVSQDSVASMIVNEKEIKYMNALLNR